MSSAAPRIVADAPQGRTAYEVVSSPEFRSLVARRWAVSAVLLALLFVSYYGFILLIALDRPLVSRKIGEAVTLAIPLGIGAILAAWILTGTYVLWANRKYDPEVERLRRRLER